MGDASVMGAWEVVVLSGGRGSRLGGVVKADVDLDGRPLLDRLLAGLSADVPVTVAGPPSPVDRGVRFCREEPAFAGPVAGLAAALDLVQAPVVVLFAADMPDAGALAGVLVEAVHATDADAVVAATDGHRQPLCAAYRVVPLRAALASFGDVANRSMRDLLARLAVDELVPTERLRALMTDIDTTDDLAAARARYADGSRADA